MLQTQASQEEHAELIFWIEKPKDSLNLNEVELQTFELELELVFFTRINTLLPPQLLSVILEPLLINTSHLGKGNGASYYGLVFGWGWGWAFHISRCFVCRNNVVM